MDNNQNREEVKYIASSLRRLDKLGELLEKWLVSVTVLEDKYNEALNDISTQFERFETILIDMAKMSDNSGKPIITGELQQKLYNARVDSLQKQLLRLMDNKNKLEEKSIDYGANPPLEITNHIIRTVEEIERVSSELKDYKELLK